KRWNKRARLWRWCSRPWVCRWRSSMAESPSAPPNRVATYLIQQLQRNPHTQSAEIIARRRVALGLKQRSEPAVGVGDTSGLRQKTRDELEKIRAGIFQLPLEPPLAKLQS